MIDGDRDYPWVMRVAEGKSAFTLPFGKKEPRAAIAQITVSGLLPQHEEDWQKVLAELDHRLAARQVIANWNAAAEEFGLDTITGVDAPALRALVELCEHVRLVHELATQIDRLRRLRIRSF
jgi:hypothetical protein